MIRILNCCVICMHSRCWWLLHKAHHLCSWPAWLAALTFWEFPSYFFNHLSSNIPLQLHNVHYIFCLSLREIIRMISVWPICSDYNKWSMDFYANGKNEWLHQKNVFKSIYIFVIQKATCTYLKILSITHSKRSLHFHSNFKKYIIIVSSRRHYLISKKDKLSTF